MLTGHLPVRLSDAECWVDGLWMMFLVSAVGCLATMGPHWVLGLCQNVYHSSSGPTELKQDDQWNNICRFHLLTSPVYRHVSHKEYTEGVTQVRTQWTHPNSNMWVLRKSMVLISQMVPKVLPFYIGMRRGGSGHER